MSISGNKGQLWNRGSAPVHPNCTAGMFQFFLRARASEAGLSDGEADIAIDDLSLSPGCQVEGDTTTAAPTTSTAPPSTTAEPCSEAGEFWCRDEADTCLAPARVCDFIPDCPTGLDEVSCGSCSFEDNQLDPSCGYLDSSTGSFSWSQVEAAGSAGPPVDHSTNSEAGHYMMVLHSDNLFGEEAVLTSPGLSPTKNMCSVRFWYHVQSHTKTVFSVKLIEAGGKKKDIFSAEHSDPMETWTSGAGLVGKKETAGATLEFISSPADCGASQCNITVALDDISLSQCQMSVSAVDCSFNDYGEAGEVTENSLCNWSQVQDDDMDWSLLVDSEGDRKGYIEILNPEAVTKYAWLQSLVIPPDQTYCLKLKYKMYGDTVGSLRLMATPNDTTVLEPEVIWQRHGSQGNGWLKGQVEIKPSLPVSFILAGGVSGAFSPISVDDLDLSVTHCPSNPACGFEEGFCSWRNKGDIDWTRGSGMELTGENFAPDHDHTTKSEFGSFLYVDPRKNEGKSAVLRYAKPAVNKTECLSLWYISQYDTALTAAQQYLDGEGNIIQTKEVWRKPAYDLASWQFVRVQLAMNSEEAVGYKVDLTAEVGTHKDALLALDDVEVQTGDCPPTTQCDFEQDLCGYGNFISDGFDWIRFSSAEDSVFVGPAVDISLDNTEGHSFIAPVGGHKMDDSATFLTPLISRDSKCLVFW